MAARKPTAAAIYCRISLDKTGEGLGVKRQETMCRRLATEKGWPVAEVYVDGSTSAFNGKTRTAYRRMLADLEAGHRDAVICVDLDRLTRHPAELEEFVELADRLRIALANVSGDTDLGSSDGRLRARIMGAVARQESERKGERVAREAEQAALRGVPRGSRRPLWRWRENPFGTTSVWDDYRGHRRVKVTDSVGAYQIFTFYGGLYGDFEPTMNAVLSLSTPFTTSDSVSHTDYEYLRGQPAEGGGPDIGNIVVSCRSCNRAKGPRTPGEWLGE